MSRIVRHSNYTEITNGLFMEIADKEFTFAEQDGVLKRIQDVVVQPITRLTRQDIEETISDTMFRPRVQDYRVYIDPATSQELLRFEEELDIQRERNRIVNERSWTDIRNMSEEEIIQYFDRISQEEEN